MALIDFKNKIITCFIVYYGPSLSGKSTNIEQLYNLTAQYGSTGVQDFRTLGWAKEANIVLPSISTIQDFTIHFQVQSLVGTRVNKESQWIMLSGADGIIFVANSRFSRMDANIYFKYLLDQYLKDNGRILEKMPYTLQLNFRDSEQDLLSKEEMLAELKQCDEPVFETIAYKGVGVLETFESIVNQIYRKLLYDVIYPP